MVERLLCELYLSGYTFPLGLALCSNTLYNCSFSSIETRLLPHQIKHYRQLNEKLCKYRRVVDTSIMGCGKTFTISAVAKKQHKHIIAFSPESSKKNWMKAFSHFRIKKEKYEWFGYNSFLCKQKPYMTPIVTLTYKNYLEELVKCKVSKQYHDKCKEKNGVLLVFDEAHFLKNDSNRSRLAIMLSLVTLKYPKCYIAMLSSTPFDKYTQCVQFAKLLGIIKQKSLTFYDRKNNCTYYDGLDELLNYSKNLEPNCQEIVGQINDKRPETIAYHYMSKVIKLHLFIAMKPALDSDTKDIKNLFVKIDDEIQLEMVKKGIIKLEKGVISLEKQNKKIPAGQALAEIQNGMKQIENGKVYVFVKLALKSLRSNPKTKVIIMANFLTSIEAIYSSLEKYSPLLIWGKTPKKDRLDIITKFQSPTDTHRILVCNTAILCTGQDLDDQHGDYPRHLYISPNYNVTNLHQATGRIFRSNTKSDGTVRFVYTKEVEKEVTLLETIALKSNVIKSMIDYKVKFPGDYPQITL